MNQSTYFVCYRQAPTPIADDLQEAIWKVALDSGAKVLALNVIEAAASGEKGTRWRNELNTMIAKHQEDRLYVHTFLHLICISCIKQSLNLEY